jgi:hypothetical protein
MINMDVSIAKLREDHPPNSRRACAFNIKANGILRITTLPGRKIPHFDKI